MGEARLTEQWEWVWPAHCCGSTTSPSGLTMSVHCMHNAASLAGLVGCVLCPRMRSGPAMFSCQRQGMQGDTRSPAATEAVPGALAAALPSVLCSVAGHRARRWLCSPGLKHHRIQRLPGINLPAKHFQDSHFQVLFSSCCRTGLGRDRVSNSLWRGLFNKSILAQKQRCPCSIAGGGGKEGHTHLIASCTPVYGPVLDSTCSAAGPQRLSCTSFWPLREYQSCRLACHAVRHAAAEGR